MARRRRGTHYAGSPRETRALAAFIKLMRAAHWASVRAGRFREQAGFTESQFAVLEALFHLGPLDQTQLKERLLTSPSNLTVVIDNLEREGHVQRRAGVADQRQRIVHLTARGRRRVEELLPGHVGRIVAVMSGLPPREQEQLGRLCRKLGYWAEALP